MSWEYEKEAEQRMDFEKEIHYNISTISLSKHHEQNVLIEFTLTLKKETGQLFKYTWSIVLMWLLLKLMKSGSLEITSFLEYILFQSILVHRVNNSKSIIEMP